MQQQVTETERQGSLLEKVLFKLRFEEWVEFNASGGAWCFRQMEQHVKTPGLEKHGLPRARRSPVWPKCREPRGE